LSSDGRVFPPVITAVITVPARVICNAVAVVVDASLTERIAYPPEEVTTSQILSSTSAPEATREIFEVVPAGAPSWIQETVGVTFAHPLNLPAPAMSAAIADEDPPDKTPAKLRFVPAAMVVPETIAPVVVSVPVLKLVKMLYNSKNIGSRFVERLSVVSPPRTCRAIPIP
jgi:hypothetical protein